MENSNKKNGIFLGVISVATLIVAIIGATFAYFSSQVSSGNDAVNVTAYEFATKLDSIERIYPDATGDSARATPALAEGIIPMLKDKLETAINSTNKCIDSKGHMVCALYKATLTNSGKAVNLNVSIESIVNKKSDKSETTKPFTHLTYQNLASSDGSTFTITGNPTVLGEQATTVKPDTVIAIEEGSTSQKTVNHYFVVYLEDPVGGETDQSEEMGATYAGKITYSTGEGADKLTGTFTLEP